MTDQLESRLMSRIQKYLLALSAIPLLISISAAPAFANGGNGQQGQHGQQDDAKKKSEDDAKHSPTTTAPATTVAPRHDTSSPQTTAQPQDTDQTQVTTNDVQPQSQVLAVQSDRSGVAVPSTQRQLAFTGLDTAQWTVIAAALILFGIVTLRFGKSA